MIPFLCKKNITESATTQTEEIQLSITQRIEENIDENANKERFQEFNDKRNDRIYKKIMFNIRNYVVLTEKEIHETRFLNNTQKMNIIILFNTAIKHLLTLI